MILIVIVILIVLVLDALWLFVYAPCPGILEVLFVASRDTKPSAGSNIGCRRTASAKTDATRGQHYSVGYPTHGALPAFPFQLRVDSVAVCSVLS